jgi:tetratricopeptide (TPR) repeat protein
LPASLTLFGAKPDQIDRAAPDFVRNLGIALVMAADGDRIGKSRLASALKMLEQAVARDPEDTPAQEAYALALSSQGRHAESLRVLEAVLGRAPQREFSLVNAAAEARQLGKLDLTIDYWRRAAEMNPSQVRYQISLARACLDARSWDECARAARAALALQPSSPQSRQYLVRALLGQRKIPEAEAEFATLMRLGPPDPEGLRRWFAAERGP